MYWSNYLSRGHETIWGKPRFDTRVRKIALSDYCISRQSELSETTAIADSQTDSFWHCWKARCSPLGGRGWMATSYYQSWFEHMVPMNSSDSSTALLSGVGRWRCSHCSNSRQRSQVTGHRPSTDCSPRHNSRYGWMITTAVTAHNQRNTDPGGSGQHRRRSPIASGDCASQYEKFG